MGLPQGAGAGVRIAALALAAVCAYAAAVPCAVDAQSGRTHALIVVGIGGTAEYRESFHAEASQIYTALTTTHGLAKEDVIYLGERVETAPEMISNTSTRANVLQVLGELSQRMGEQAWVQIRLRELMVKLRWDSLDVK